MNENDIERLMLQMDGKDEKSAYQALLELERLSDETGLLYPYTKRFAEMISSEKYAIRVRGIRLFCRQARWDRDGIMEKHLDSALTILKDDKPTAVRQALAALKEVVRYKPASRDKILQAANDINVLDYKDTMRGLILKDIMALSDSE